MIKHFQTLQYCGEIIKFLTYEGRNAPLGLFMYL